MALSFSFRKEFSPIFGSIYRPVAQVFFWSKANYWSECWMVVDSGADYTLLPRYMSDDLKVNLKKDCQKLMTFGVGGGSTVYHLAKIKARLGNWERNIPIGFVDSNEVPPLLGRHQFMETFETIFKNHKVSFNN